MRPEWALQVRIRAFVREAIAVPSIFLAFDRSQAQSARQHLNEAARGITAGTPDTVLLVSGRPSIWCELKAGKNKPMDDQERIGEAIIAAGHAWFWTSTVDGYRRGLALLGVPLADGAAMLADRFDAFLAKATERDATKKTTRKPRATRATMGQVARLEAVRRLLPF